MSIIKSITDSFDGFVIKTNNDRYYLRLIGKSVTNIISIVSVHEEWNLHTDIRVFTKHLNNLWKITRIIETEPIMCFEFFDKHVYVMINNIDYTKNSDYVYIDKEFAIEIKGGKYIVDEQRIEDIHQNIQTSED